MTLRDRESAPKSPFPVLPLRSGPVYPGTQLTIAVGRPRSLELLRLAHEGDVIGVTLQRDPKQLDPATEDLFPAGTFARIVKIIRQNDRGYRVVLEGVGRLRFDRLTSDTAVSHGYGELVLDENGDTDEARLLVEALRRELSSMMEDGAALLDGALAHDIEPGRFADGVAALLGLDNERAARVLGEVDVPTRLRVVAELVGEARALSALRTKVEQDVQRQFGKQQRDTLLRRQLETIKKELGEEAGADDDVSRLRERLQAKNPPPEVLETAERELKRLASSGGQGPEANVIRTYVERLAALPWNDRAAVNDDIEGIAAQLEADHYGLEDVKKRVLEHMAVHKLSGNPRGTLLCLVGPPGVGKTSLGESVARATGRPFVRISLGGVRDEAEIRGHRRTYVGALPGRIVTALEKAKVKNPVMLLDEIDKLSQSFQGSPEAALLEVLDPEQNATFTDHYLDVPFDLSEVLFLCTANSLDTLSPPLRDRLEIVEVTGYTEEEKRHIARRHLIPKRIAESGVPPQGVQIEDDALRAMIAEYTREAGVRQLDRLLRRLGRVIALDVARGEVDAPIGVTVTDRDLGRYLGRPRFSAEIAETSLLPGVATGLAWTPFGGDILFVETSAMPGRGRLEITGQLGDVMKESARAALSYIRSNAWRLRIKGDTLEHADIHLHVPAGAVPKDGPSAGVTIFTALTSLLTDRAIRGDTAMTGECSLRGRVLPVGGIKAKLLAAHRAGIRRVILPRQNERDLEDVPAAALADLEIILADSMDEVLAAALVPAPLAFGASADVPRGLLPAPADGHS